MILHYIKVALRNLWKYKTQSLISIVGLAVGFTCFALASLWLRYEMTYDAFHKNAKDTYAIILPSTKELSGVTMSVPATYLEQLQETFPEIKEIVYIGKSQSEEVDVDGNQSPAHLLFTTPSVVDVFDITVLDGRFPEVIPKGREVAITKEKAALLYGDEDPIGKRFDRLQATITGVVSGYSHTNYPFDIITPIRGGGGTAHGLIVLHPDVTVEAFKQKLKEHVVFVESRQTGLMEITGATLIPLTELHYKDPMQTRSIKFGYVGLFGALGILVILCSLFNYITLFISRFRIRSKEFALRLVCGSSRGSLISLLSAEYLISLILASLLGFCLVKIFLPSFEELAEIRMNISDIYGELLLYFLAVLVLSLMAFWLAIGLFGKRSLQGVIQKSKKQILRKLSLVAQLFITIVLIFCSVVMIKQMHFLHNSSNIGFEFKNRASVSISAKNVPSWPLANLIKQIPEIEEIIDGFSPLLPKPWLGSSTISIWDDQPNGDSEITIQYIPVSDEYLRFYDFQLLEGELLEPDDPPGTVLINESAVKAFGWTNPVGKRFSVVGAGSTESQLVKGVVKNIYNLSSVIEVKPFYYAPTQILTSSIIFKYKEGSFNVVKEKIDKIDEDFFGENTSLTGARYMQLFDTEEEYNKQFQSETSLLLILNFVSLVCVLISVFGFFSLIALNLEERRKEMAIRKVNGATPRNIIGMYFKEYFLLLLISSLLAFPIAYIIMKRWLEQYIKQTEISAWIYVVILFVIAIVIALCTGWRIWRSSRENPVETLKSN